MRPVPNLRTEAKHTPRSSKALFYTRTYLRQLWIILILLIAASMQAYPAEVYIWVDEHGKKHYSDQPPDEQQQPTLDVQTRAFELKNIDEGYPAGIVADPTRGERKAKQVQAQKAARANLQEQCAKAHADLAMLSGRVAFNDDAGNEVRVTEAQRRAMQEKLSAVITERCH